MSQGQVTLATIARSAMAMALAGILAGGCGPAGATTTPSQGTRAEPSAPASASASADRPIATTAPRPTEVPGPPSLSLRGSATGAIRGELGSFLWDGLGSDAPWIVPATASHVASGGYLEVVVAPPRESDHWTARWAPVAGGAPGDPSATAEGGAGGIRLTAPSRPGTWGLALEVSFGDGRRGTWYWRLDVDP